MARWIALALATIWYGDDFDERQIFFCQNSIIKKFDQNLNFDTAPNDLNRGREANGGCFDSAFNGERFVRDDFYFVVRATSFVEIQNFLCSECFVAPFRYLVIVV